MIREVSECMVDEALLSIRRRMRAKSRQEFEGGANDRSTDPTYQAYQLIEDLPGPNTCDASLDTNSRGVARKMT